MLYMVIERFKNQDAVPVYRRFHEKGRMTPDGLEYLSSWVDTKLERCYQIMETSDPTLMDEWIENWSDIVEFEVISVTSSADAAQAMQEKV